MEIKLTSDWILNNLTSSLYAKDDKVNIGTNENYHFVKLVMDEMKIEYEEGEIFLSEDFTDPEIFFNFSFNKNKHILNKECPTFVKEIVKLMENNLNY
jgi:hypothetical protein